MRILVVEDDYVTAQNISAILSSDGSVVETASLGEEGLERAKQLIYDLIILDLTLPDVHGLAVLKTLRAANFQTPVLVVSADASREMRTVCLERGADDYLTKPFYARELTARVHAICRRVGGHAKLMNEANDANALLMSLTPREREVLHEIAIGHSNKLAAHSLGMSPRTIEVHRAHIMKKLCATCFADVVRIQSAAARFTGETMAMQPSGAS
jgi:two-component system, LuxR family, response regulator FixJ